VTDEIEGMIATIGAALRQRPDYPYNLVGLAEMVAARKAKRRAADLAHEAMALGRDDPATIMRGRRLLASLIPGYHVPMMNDARRNAAWDAALRRAIRPGMTVLEIGTGAGMLALMAARAGAAKVVTCEYNPVAAQMARTLAAHNGYADRIQVITKRSQALRLGTELDRPADLLVCDIFADGLLDFDPLGAIADARQRLLAPGAPSVPMAASLRAALIDWQDYRRVGHIDTACGFDLAPFADFIPTSILRPIGAAGVDPVSEDIDLFRFDFSESRFPPADRHSMACRATIAGEANGIARWIRLDLDHETMIEARPEAGATFFSGLTVTPLDAPVPVRPGDTVTIGAAHNGRTISTWLERG
jgi:type II protein arginine methyltransferase